MPSPLMLYSAMIQTLIAERELITKKLNTIFRFRLLISLAIIAVVWAGFGVSYYYFYPAFVLFLAFIYFVRQHGHARAKEKIIIAKLSLNQNEINQLLGQSAEFDFIPDTDYRNHIYADDLDIFGAFSLFGLINRSSSLVGKSTIVNDLLSPVRETESLARRKEALMELAPLLYWRQDFITTSSQTTEKSGDIKHLREWNALPQFFEHRASLMPVATIAAVAFGSIVLFTSGEMMFLLLGVLSAINLSIYQFVRKEINVYFSSFRDYGDLFLKWSLLGELITSLTYTSAIGIEISTQTKAAGKGFREIYNLSNLLSFRQNGMLFGLMNGLFLFDLWYIYQIEKWRRQYNTHLFTWIDAIGKMDSLVSYANYQFNHPAFCEAKIVAGRYHVKAEKLGHPLLLQEQSVCNDFEIGINAPAQIITGSNMSGKSTFLRSVGLNMVLALNGLPVCARSFSCSPLMIASCIRINDSLEASESYFKAEINKLSRVKKLLETGEPYIILLDEILRGTNSNDKNAGTRKFYMKIRDVKCLALLATHDVEIGHLAYEFPQSFENFHFESFIDGTNISFDYQLKPGVSTTTNATSLMQNMGLID